MELPQTSQPSPQGLLPDPKSVSDDSTSASKLPERINEKQVIELFEWEGRSSQLASEFYEKHQQQLISGTLTLPDVAEMIESLHELELKEAIVADTEDIEKDINRELANQKRKQPLESSHITSEVIKENPSNYSYKKRLYLDIEAMRELSLDLSIDEYIILTWAYDFAQGGGNKSLKEHNQE